MAVASNRSVSITNTGDITSNQTFAAAANASAPGDIGLVALASGFNSVPVPANSKAATIIPPAGNTVTLTLKGITGDTGIPLHLTDPTSIGLASGATAIGLTTSGTVSLRILFT